MTLPRGGRLPDQIDAARQGVVNSRMAGGSLNGQTRAALPVKNLGPIGIVAASGSFAVVYHGADGTVGRPTATLVYWIGAATPANATPFDFWYTATI